MKGKELLRVSMLGNLTVLRHRTRMQLANNFGRRERLRSRLDAISHRPATSWCGMKWLRGAVIYLTPMLQPTIT